MASPRRKGPYPGSGQKIPLKNPKSTARVYPWPRAVGQDAYKMGSDAGLSLTANCTGAYADRRLGLSRAALEIFVRFPPRRILLQTRSPLIERDIDVIRELGTRVIASLTIETDDDNVRRVLTPTAPSIVRRLTTARRLRQAGIFTQIAIAPMMPNHPQRFAAIIDEAADPVIVCS